MEIKRILTDEQKAGFVTDIIDYGTDFVAPLYATVDAIEQAVLQSLRVRKENRHLDDIAVDQFAASMKTKLAKKRAEGRGGWQDMSASELSQLLHEHVEKGDPLDVANFCMMLHENGQTIMQSPEMQALRKDADRYRLIRGGKQWVVAATQTGSHVDGEHLDELVDDAMEKQK